MANNKIKNAKREKHEPVITRFVGISKLGVAVLSSALLVACGGNGGSTESENSSSAESIASSAPASSSSSQAVSSEARHTLTLQENDTGICSFQGIVETEHDGFTGSGFINSDNTLGASIVYRINAESSDNYQLNIRYANGGDARSASVVINDGANGEHAINFASGAWDSWQIISINTDLVAGENKIQIQSDSPQGLGNIDYISIEGAQAEGVSCSAPASSSTASSSSANNGAITGASCQSTGSVTVNATIIVGANQVYDGQCQTFNPTSALGDGSQNESQKPVFRVEQGATLRNVIIGNNGADGVHVYGDANIENITWTDVGEDALTIKSSGTVNVKNISGYNGEDKFFQINAASSLNVENCIIDRAGKALRQNGGTTFRIDVVFNRCSIRNMGEGVFRTDSTVSTARITNSVLSNAGRVCIGNWASCTSQNISQN